MAVRWQAPFASFDGREYTIRIYDDSYTGIAVEMTCAATPIETSEDTDDDIFSPSRPQTGNIHLVVNSLDDIADIVPEEITGRPVELVDGQGAVWWSGYLQDNVLTGSWDAGPLEVTFPICSPLEVMKNVPLDAAPQYTSLRDILGAILNKAGMYKTLAIPSDGTDYLSLMFNTVVLLGDGERDFASYPGETDGTTPPSAGAYCLDVIDEICKYFGWTARENGDELWFVDVNASLYKKHGITYSSGAASINTTYTQTTISSKSVIIGGSRHSYEYVPGASYIDLSEQARTDFIIVRTSLADGKTFGGLLTKYDYKYINYESGSGSASYIQYGVSSGNELTSFVDLLSRAYDDSAYCGGQLVFLSKLNYFAGLTTDEERFGFTPVLAIKQGSSKKVAVFRSVRPLRGSSFPDGLALKGNLLTYDVTEGIIPDENGRLNFSLKWGDKYYSPSTRDWDVNEHIITSDAGSIIHGGRIDIDGGALQVAPNDLYYIYPDVTLDGEIVLIIYGKGSSSSYRGIDFIENLEMSPFTPYDGIVNLNTDYSENHFRHQLVYAKNAIYERSCKFSSHINDAQYGESFVLSGSGSYYTGNPGVTLLQTLSKWQDHTAVQIKVVTLFERGDGAARPCDNITLSETDYHIVHQTTDWRNSLRTYTLQQE